MKLVRMHMGEHSQQCVARRAGTSPGQFSKVLNGKHALSWDLARKLGPALDVDAGRLFVGALAEAAASGDRRRIRLQLNAAADALDDPGLPASVRGMLEGAVGGALGVTTPPAPVLLSEEQAERQRAARIRNALRKPPRAPELDPEKFSAPSPVLLADD